MFKIVNSNFFLLTSSLGPKLLIKFDKNIHKKLFFIPSRHQSHIYPTAKRLPDFFAHINIMFIKFNLAQIIY